MSLARPGWTMLRPAGLSKDLWRATLSARTAPRTALAAAAARVRAALESGDRHALQGLYLSSLQAKTREAPLIAALLRAYGHTPDVFARSRFVPGRRPVPLRLDRQLLRALRDANLLNARCRAAARGWAIDGSGGTADYLESASGNWPELMGVERVAEDKAARSRDEREDLDLGYGIDRASEDFNEALNLLGPPPSGVVVASGAPGGPTPVGV